MIDAFPIRIYTSPPEVASNMLQPILLEQAHKMDRISDPPISTQSTFPSEYGCPQKARLKYLKPKSADQSMKGNARAGVLANEEPYGNCEVASRDNKDVGLGRASVSVMRSELASPKHFANSCTVCLAEFNTGEHVRELPCRHQYHAECIGIYFLCIEP